MAKFSVGDYVEVYQDLGFAPGDDRYQLGDRFVITRKSMKHTSVCGGDDKPGYWVAEFCLRKIQPDDVPAEEEFTQWLKSLDKEVVSG